MAEVTEDFSIHKGLEGLAREVCTWDDNRQPISPMVLKELQGTWAVNACLSLRLTFFNGVLLIAFFLGGGLYISSLVIAHCFL